MPRNAFGLLSEEPREPALNMESSLAKAFLLGSARAPPLAPPVAVCSGVSLGQRPLFVSVFDPVFSVYWTLGAQYIVAFAPWSIEQIGMV